MESRQTPSSEVVRAQLERILASAPFAKSTRSQRFLRYVVEGWIKNQDESLKEYVIAVEVFDRDSSYDPAVDATVRVEAGRLRSRLRDYYANTGKSDPLVVDIPRGSYRPIFHESCKGSVEDSAKPAVDNSEPNRSREHSSVPKPGRKLRWIMVAAPSLTLLLGFVGYYNTRHPRSVTPSNLPVILAVVPFANDSGVETNSYLTDGLTDNLIRQLSELPQLRVVSRAAVDRVNRSTAATQLGATVLLWGALRRNPEGHLVLNSELSNARDGTVLRSSQYLPDESDLRPVQADIVHDVIQGLNLHLNGHQSSGAQRPLTSNPAAFQAFLRGESAARGRETAERLHAAIQDFEEAVRLDPTFALAYSSMAESHLKLAIYFERPHDHVPSARQYSARALALDPSLLQAHSTLGLIDLLFDWNLAGAQSELAAADVRQDAIWQLGCTAHLLGTNGRFRHAEEDLQQMLEFDPHSAMIISEMGCTNYYAGRYDESIRYFHQAITADPRSVLPYWGLGRSLCLQHHYKAALESLRQFKAVSGFEPPVITGEIGFTAASSGDRRAALETIRQLKQEAKNIYVDPYFIAIIYLALKDRDSTYTWLEKAYQERSPFLISIATDPKWSDSHGDPRFQTLWNRMTSSERGAEPAKHNAAVN